MSKTKLTRRDRYGNAIPSVDVDVQVEVESSGAVWVNEVRHSTRADALDAVDELLATARKEAVKKAETM